MSDLDNLNIATQFDGTFDLTFLEDHETVRSAGPNTNAVIVRTKAGDVRVQKGDWLIRKPNGELVKRSEI